MGRHKGYKKEASKPFGLGARASLGANFAWIEINMVLARLVWGLNMVMVKGIGEGLDWDRDNRPVMF